MKNKYGVLYNWSAAMDSNRTTDWTGSETFPASYRGICPEGWHLTTDAECITLEIAVGMSVADADITGSYRGDIAYKFASGCDWSSTNIENAAGNYATANRNSSLFSILPSGYYNGSFHVEREETGFWTSIQENSNETYYRYFTYDQAGIYHGYYFKYVGRPVRCVRN